MKKNKNLIIGIAVIFLSEILLFIILHLTVTKVAIQAVFGVFIGFLLLMFLGYFIAFKRTAIALKRSDDPIAMIGQKEINKYFPESNKVTIEDLILIKKAINFKYMVILLVGILINVGFTLLGFFA